MAKTENSLAKIERRVAKTEKPLTKTERRAAKTEKPLAKIERRVAETEKRLAKIEHAPQWLSGPSPPLPSPPDRPPITEPDSNYVLTRCYWHGLT